LELTRPRWTPVFPRAGTPALNPSLPSSPLPWPAVVWALFYALAKVAPVGTDPVYFALVYYTTLGYGDIVSVPEWSLLGPITAANGILLFGWSAAVIFEALRTTIPGLRA
jgi:hypothetical protein